MWKSAENGKFYSWKVGKCVVFIWFENIFNFKIEKSEMMIFSIDEFNWNFNSCASFPRLIGLSIYLRSKNKQESKKNYRNMKSQIESIEKVNIEIYTRDIRIYSIIPSEFECQTQYHNYGDENVENSLVSRCVEIPRRIECQIRSCITSEHDSKMEMSLSVHLIASSQIRYRFVHEKLNFPFNFCHGVTWWCVWWCSWCWATINFKTLRQSSNPIFIASKWDFGNFHCVSPCNVQPQLSSMRFNSLCVDD